VELELFLIQHPELEINLDELSLVTLENEVASFSNKNALKKSEADLVSETQFIAYIENQLPENERLALEKSCAINPSLSKELALYNNTIAKADETKSYLVQFFGYTICSSSLYCVFNWLIYIMAKNID
jgi:hypothetical protein